MSRRPTGLAAVLLLAAVSIGAMPAHAATSTVTVTVHNNVFAPTVQRIEPGDTVRWTAVDGDHTVTADDGSFDFSLPNRADAVDHLFTELGTTRYHCKLHGAPGGQGMSGVIQVGEPPPPPPPPPLPTLVVPDDVPTITEAATGAQPGTVILVRPGAYAEQVVVTVPDLVIRGLGGTPAAVVLSGQYRRPVGVEVQAPGVRIENLTVTGYTHTGVRVHGSTGTGLEDLVVDDNDFYGVDVRAAAGTTLRRVTATSHTVAGVAVRDCAACGARVDDAVLERNAAGLLAAQATGLVVRGSTVRGNRVGVVLRDAAGVTLTGNAVTDNTATDVRQASWLTAPPLGSGAGVWAIGGRANRIYANTLTGHTYNVAVTGPGPALDTRVEHNTVGGALHADLGRDGLGTGVCFSDNRRTDGAPPTSDPPAAETIYGCDLPTSAGLPFPLVTTNLVAHSVGLGAGIPGP